MKPVCNDHLFNKIYYLWFIQWCVLMKTEGIDLLLLTISVFWSSWPPRWAPEGREVSHKVVVIDRFHCRIQRTASQEVCGLIIEILKYSFCFDYDSNLDLRSPLSHLSRLLINYDMCKIRSSWFFVKWVPLEQIVTATYLLLWTLFFSTNTILSIQR